MMPHTFTNLACTRRDWLRLSGLSLLGATGASWLPGLARAVEETPQTPHKAVILLWMAGGPSQMETFDPKPGHKNAGPVQAIDTSVPGMRISEYLPKIAQQAQHFSVIRSMSTKEGDHSRATYLLHTSYLPQGPVKYPTIGSSLSKELGQTGAELPNFVSISPQRFVSPGAFAPGFLGPQYAPLVVGETGNRGTDDNPLPVRNLAVPKRITSAQFDQRLELWNSLETDFQKSHPGLSTQSHRSAYEQAVKMIRSTAARAFDLTEEAAALRDEYGRNPFGQGCLLARRLVERGVPFVEVSLSGAEAPGGLGWDTHANNFDSVKTMCGVLDPAWATLLRDLKDRGLLDHTLVVWMGEFGRTPTINPQTGRDHFPVAWSSVLCGGGIKTGQVIGQTSDDGQQVKERPVAVADLLATVCETIHIDPLTSNLSNVGRPVRLIDPEAKPIQELLV